MVILAMQTNLPLSPDGLNKSLTALIETKVQQAETLDAATLLQRVQEHVTEARQAAQGNPMVHVALAEAIEKSYVTLHSTWESLPAYVQPWLKGAMLYFSEPDDDEPDFESPIGFEDDVEILNACLKMAKLEQFCLNPEDYD